MQLELVTKEMVHEAIEQVRTKKNPVSLPRVKFESFEEGKIAQIMHIGPFSEECPTVEKVHSFIKESKSQRTGKHHEIFLSDIRRVAPEKWKTIIRQPISCKGITKTCTRKKQNFGRSSLHLNFPVIGDVMPKRI